LKIILNGKEYEIKQVCKMSDEPLKFAIGIKITEDLWRDLKESKEFKAEEIECKITDEIDIGDTTWFVFLPKDGKKFLKKYADSILNI